MHTEEKNKRLATGFSIAWCLISLLILEWVYNHLDGNITLGLFNFLVILSPIWLNFGWWKIYPDKKISKRFLLCLIVLYVIWCFYASKVSKELDAPIFIGILLISALISLSWIVFYKNQASNSYDEELEKKLLKNFEMLSDNIKPNLDKISINNNNLPISTSLSNTFCLSYSLILLRFSKEKFWKKRKAINTFKEFRTNIVVSYCLITQPKIEGVKPLTENEIINSDIYNSASELFKSFDSIIEKMDARTVSECILALFFNCYKHDKLNSEDKKIINSIIQFYEKIRL